MLPHWWAPLLMLALVACDDGGTSSGSGGSGGSGAGNSSGSSSGGNDDPGSTLGKPQFGDPELASLDRIAFGPGGVILLGDGAKDRIVAVETGDTGTGEDLTFNRVDNLTTRIASAIGTEVAPIEIQVRDIAVNPLTKRMYIAAWRSTDISPHLLWLDANGAAHEVDMSQVVYASVSYSPIQTPGSTVTDIAWLDGLVVASVMKQAAVASHVVMIETPFEHGAPSAFMKPRIYHRSASSWMTDIAIDRLFVFPGNFNQQWMGLSFAGTPVSKYQVSELLGGPVQQTGRTQFDFGLGRSIRDFVYYDDGKDEWLLAAVFNLQFDGQTLAARVHRDLLVDSTFVQENAPILFDPAGSVLVEGVQRVVDFDGADHLELVGNRIVLLRQDTLISEAFPTSSPPDP
jgi:hypothetical protein